MEGLLDYRTVVDALESRKISCSAGDVTTNAWLLLVTLLKEDKARGLRLTGFSFMVGV